MTGESLWGTVSFLAFVPKFGWRSWCVFLYWRFPVQETNHRWELFSPHNERKWLEEVMHVQGGRFHRLHLRSLLVNLCLIKQAQSWKKDHADGKQIRSGEVVARLCMAGLPGAQGSFGGIWRRNLKITLFNATAKSCLAMLTQQNRDCKPRHGFLSAAVTTA